MSAVNKPEIVRLRVSESDNTVLVDAGGQALNRNDIASLLLTAAIEAVRENGGHFRMPLKLRVEETEELRAPLPKRKAA